MLGGWDINSADLGEAMSRAKVLDYDLQRQLQPLMKGLKPLPSVYYPSFIAANQGTSPAGIGSRGALPGKK